jgi:hypothetical protein
MITSGGGVLAVMAGYDWNQENPATGYDHRITTFNFQPFSRVFPPNPPRTLSSGECHPEKRYTSLSLRNMLEVLTIPLDGVVSSNQRTKMMCLFDMICFLPSFVLIILDLSIWNQHQLHWLLGRNSLNLHYVIIK